MSFPFDGFSHHMSQSGVFVPTADARLTSAPIILSNPGNLLPFEQQIEQRDLWSERREKVELLKPKEQPWAEMSDFIAYSRAIIDIAEYLVLQRPDCCLGPLRGASFPASLAQMTAYGKVAFDYFNYRHRDRAGRPAEIVKELHALISRRNTGQELFSLAVIDGAIGGHGITDLVPMIKQVWRQNPKFASQIWELNIHLLHDKRQGTNPKKMRSAAYPPNSEPGKFVINVFLHEVPKLVIEDYSAAIDFLFDKERQMYLPCEKEGKLLLVQNHELLTISSPNAFLLYKNLFIEGIRRALESHSRYRLEKVVWKPGSR